MLSCVSHTDECEPLACSFAVFASRNALPFELCILPFIFYFDTIHNDAGRGEVFYDG